MVRRAWILAACITACTQAHVTREQIRLDPPATFGARIPCADCPGIEVTLSIAEDSSYRLRHTHVQALEGTDTSSVQDGRWSFDEEGRLVLVDGNDVMHFEVLDDGLRMVHATGEHASASPADYELVRVDQSLTDTRWKLVEVEGRPVASQSEEAGPYIEFSLTSGRVTGSGGCNGFGGPWERQGERISIGPLVTTRMACATGMAIEQAFVRALESADRLTIDAGLLTLHAGDSLVARLSARHGA